jgi:hypothetical protein
MSRRHVLGADVEKIINISLTIVGEEDEDVVDHF